MPTPKRLISTSRPTSPLHHHQQQHHPHSDQALNGSAVLAAALEKKINRKRKIIPPSLITTPATPAPQDNEDSEDMPPEKTPRQSGSMISGHDDVVTRMKNIQLIELGKHRIKPWYFAPYPQVSSAIANSRMLNSMKITSRSCVQCSVYSFVNFV